MSQPQYPPHAPEDYRDEPTSSVPYQPLPFSEPYRLARDQAPPYRPEITYDQPFSMEPGVVRRAGSPRWMIAAGVLRVVLVMACIGAFVVIGFGAKSVSDKIGKDRQAAAKDVRVSDCVRDRSTGFMTASVLITNHGTDTANYVVDVAFDSADGTRQLDSGVATASNLAGGGTATVPVRAASAGPSGFMCTIIDATRF